MKALYAGTFDPFTVGHLSIARESLHLFDSLIIAIGNNELKNTEWSIEERLEQIKGIFKDDERVEVLAYTGLTTTFAKEKGAGVLVRGLRNTVDFEKEKELADINLSVSGVRTVFIPCEPSLSFISSSMVKELMHNGFNPSKYIAGKITLHENLEKK